MLAVSTAEVVVSITLAAVMFVVWFIAIFLVVLDDISIGGKIAWSLALIFLAPISIPAYFFLRHRRHSRRPQAHALDR
jgi:membrane protein implicated in regulation of membrane protease activity